MIRLPRYLDEELVRTLADYIGIEVAASKDVRRTISTERSGKGGLKTPIAEGTLERRGANQEEESYSAPVRPVRLLNDVLSALTESNELISLDQDPNAALVHRSAIEVSGSLKLSPVSEVAAVLAMILPLAQAGTDLDSVSSEQVMSLLVQRRSVEAPIVVELQPGTGPYRFISVLSPSAAYGDTVLDELEGDYTVFGTLDKVMGEGGSLSLEQYMLPGLNRTLRRALGGEQLGGLLKSFGEASGRELDVKDLEFTGPGALIGAIAIYP